MLPTSSKNHLLESVQKQNTLTERSVWVGFGGNYPTTTFCTRKNRSVDDSTPPLEHRNDVQKPNKSAQRLNWCRICAIFEGKFHRNQPTSIYEPSESTYQTIKTYQPLTLSILSDHVSSYEIQQKPLNQEPVL